MSNTPPSHAISGKDTNVKLNINELCDSSIDSDEEKKALWANKLLNISWGSSWSTLKGRARRSFLTKKPCHKQEQMFKDNLLRLNPEALLEKKNNCKNKRLRFNRYWKDAKKDWSMIYEIFFKDYFNYFALSRRLLINPGSTNNVYLTQGHQSPESPDKDKQEYLFDIKEIEMRMKMAMSSIKLKGNSNTIFNKDNAENSNDNKNCINDNTIQWPIRSKWGDKTLNEILKEKPNISDSVFPPSLNREIINMELTTFLPSFIKSFNKKMESLQLDRLVQKQNLATTATTATTALKLNSDSKQSEPPSSSKGKESAQKRTPLTNSNLHVSSSKQINQNLLNILNKDQRQYPLTPKSETSPKQEMSETHQGIFNNLEMNINSGLNQSNSAQNITLQKTPFQTRIEFLIANKQLFEKMLKKYPNYEDDIINVVNKFKSYQVEISKDDRVFKDVGNREQRVFFDFRKDQDQSTDKYSKKYQIKEKVINKARDWKQFIHSYNRALNEA